MFDIAVQSCKNESNNKRMNGDVYGRKSNLSCLWYE